MNFITQAGVLVLSAGLACGGAAVHASEDGSALHQRPRGPFTPKIIDKTAPPVEISEKGDFSEQALRNGVIATREQCSGLSSAVWAETAEGDSACLKYWAAGFVPGAKVERAAVYFSGDAWEGPGRTQPMYLGLTNDVIVTWPAQWSAELGVPFVFLARPGTFGASGDHTQRRRPAESKLISSALDALKQRLNIAELVVAGFSGGGHVTSSLVTLRRDIVCAVPGGAPSSPRLRTRLMNWTIDSTGYADSYEPTEHLRKDATHPKLRIFVVGDPRDKNGVWPAQVVMADKAREHGIAAEVIEAVGTGPTFHGGQADLVRSVASWCAKDLPTPEILRRAGQRL